jgi:hypothetical protein
VILSTPPSVVSVEYETKSVQLLGSTLDVGVIEVTTDQELYLLDTVHCPPYNCSSENYGCMCDYSYTAPNGCGTSTVEGCECKHQEYCDELLYTWTDLEVGVAVQFSITAGDQVFFRYFHTTCQAVRVC